MKRTGILILTILLGASIATAFFLGKQSQFTKGQPGSIHRTDHLIRSADISYSEGETMAFPDFKNASRKVMDAVVHIQTSRSIRQSGASPQEQLPEPFRDFFERFYGPGDGLQGQELPRQQRMGAGSGVILNEEGFIVTNNHVIANADEIKVTLHNNQTFEADVIGVDPSTDLALLKIEQTNLSYIPLVNSDSLMVGEWVLAVGNPFNLTSTVTAGIISAKARNINIVRDQYAIESFIQTDAAINPGNSGGALVTLGGGLVGINTAIASPTGSYSGYGFAVPSNIVGKVVEDLMEYGVVQRGYLGIVIRNVDDELNKEKDLEVTEGVYIDSVLENSAAEKAGIRKGDVITSVDGSEVQRSAQLQELIARHRPGESVEMTVHRKGKQIKKSAVLQSREGSTQIISKEKGAVLGRLGAEFEDIHAETSRKLGIQGGVRVVRLHAGVLSQQTDLREGFIITKVNNKEVGSVKEFISAIEGLKGGVMLEGVYEGMQGSYFYAFGL
jgi:Do/DeqQ family serine protease